MVQVARRFALSLRASAKTAKVFNGQHVTGRKAVHNAAARLMQHLPHKAPLPSRKPCPQPPQRPGAFGRAIQLRADLGAFCAVVEPLRLERTPGETLARRKRRQEALPQIDTHHPTGRWGIRHRNANGQVDIPASASVATQPPTLHAARPSKPVAMVWTQPHGNAQAPVRSRKADAFALQRKRALVVVAGGGAVVLCAMAFAPSHAGDGPNGQVGRQAQRAELSIDEPLEFELVEGAACTGHLQRQIARLREALEGFLQSSRLRGCRIEPCAQRQRLHGASVCGKVLCAGVNGMSWV